MKKMKIKKIRSIFKKSNLDYYVKVYLTFDEANYIKDYLEERIDKTAVGELKKGLEKLLK